MTCPDKRKDEIIIAEIKRRKKKIQQNNEIQIQWDGDLCMYDMFIQPNYEIIMIQKTDTGWIATCKDIV